MRWLSSQKKKMAYLYYQRYFGSLTTHGRIDPPADFVRQQHPPRWDPLWETSFPVWKLRLPNPRAQSFSSSGRLPSWRRSLPRLEWAALGARVRPHYPPHYLPSRAPGKVRSGASFPIPDFPNPQGGGPNTESTSPLLASPGQKANSQK